MTGLRWYPQDLCSFGRETACISMQEHGAYRLLLDEYYKTGRPLGLDVQRLYPICKAITEEERRAVLSVLHQFFILRKDGYHNTRADGVLREARENYRRKLQRFKVLNARRPSPIEWAEIRSVVFERDDYTCQYCGKRGGDLECDHVIPVCRGGKNTFDNLKTACLPCNRAKGTKTLDEWIATGGLS